MVTPHAARDQLGDPNYEPTDEELAELMHEAFADVPARNAAALAKLENQHRRPRGRGQQARCGDASRAGEDGPDRVRMEAGDCLRGRRRGARRRG